MSQKRITPITGLSEEDRELLLKIGEGKISKGVRIVAAIAREALNQKLLAGKYGSRNWGQSYGFYWTLNGTPIYDKTSWSREDKKHILRDTPRASHPYLGRYLSKKQLRETGHFTEKVIRSIYPGRFAQDSKGYWWKRTDPQRCFYNNRGQVMATYCGVHGEEDFTDYLMSDG
ncbi:hypothetical protein PN466_25590 [Roseofilum reptotaenium CS-1145]|uniref:Uncharacterized protein n=1 Tax=Roseofilum reptotaenium AO1-A TaxID=1925591 RepID=A0A1L9QVD0_9CYAN|nr:hypothetical protein [Roseofilum reptotaenium]MDB9520323.1 hypothetical protein [Roseofilum reptotaenium CS-1145]OJJ26641.1 hypothetical protein BI308_04495 [Roseofilum reptotaenium AO1-A]